MSNDAHVSRSDARSEPDPVAANPSVTVAPVLSRLGAQAADVDHVDLAARLAELQAWLAGDLKGVEEALLQTTGPNLAQRAGWHILAAGGKRLRPLCTLLASRFGPSQDPAAHTHARNLAISVELVHAATLLHDDVVDLADTRRGKPTARALHGNEVAIFAGDWLLVEALRRIVSTGHGELINDALATIEQMILAEVEQGERAKQLAEDAEGYQRVIDGKTAALFRFALRCGARSSGCSAAVESALVAFGSELGTAFQLIDDVLDFEGDPGETGKALLADLREGKVTLPLSMTLRGRPDLRPAITEIRRATVAGEALDPRWAHAVVAAVRETGSLQTARTMAVARTHQAIAALERVPQSPAREALIAIAHALTARHT